MMSKHSLYEVLFSMCTLPAALKDKVYRDELSDALDKLIVENRHHHRYLLLSKGHVQDHLFFLQEGFARCFFYDESSGREITTIFWKERNIVCDPVSFFKREGSRYHIEVLPGSLLLSLSYRQLEDIYQAFPETQVFTRCLSLQYAYYYSRRNNQLMASSLKERYLDLVALHPGILLKVPKEMIASYLNITPQSFSRLLREMNNR